MGKIKVSSLQEAEQVYPVANLRKVHNTLDLTNQRFGHLVALYPTVRKKRRSWVCKCDCGTYTCFNTDNLTCQGVVTCGPACIYKKRKTHNLMGKTFGRLTALQAVGPNKYGYMQWQCKCTCGNTTIVVAKYLESGKTLSCGACPDQLKSKGNAYIHEWLLEHNIKFRPEVRFDDCINKYPLPFDFVLYNEENKVIACIEYQGNLHYKATGGWITEEHVQEVKLRDSIKKQYCITNGIPLLCIPYTEYKNLDVILTNWTRGINA